MITNPILAANAAVDVLTNTLRNLDSATVLLDRLESVIPSTRAQRAPSVKVVAVRISTVALPTEGIPVQVTAKTGDTGQYNSRITFHPKQGFNCSCPDLQQRKMACKHVAALAVECRKRFWAISDLITADVDSLKSQVEAIESTYRNLSVQVLEIESKASDALGDALKILGS